MADRKEPKVGTMGPKPKGDLSAYMDKDAASAPTKKEPDADFDPVTNPKRAIAKREEKAGYACGGKVRGGGCATKGFGKVRML